MTEPGNFCEHCGSPLDPDAKFCGECGRPVSEEAPPAPASALAPGEEIKQALPNGQPVHVNKTKKTKGGKDSIKDRKKRFFLLRPRFLVPLILMLALLALVKWWPFEPAVSWVSALALSPDGQRIAAAEASDVRVWNASDPSRPKILTGPQRWLVALAFHPGGEILAGLDRLGRAVVWDIDAGKVLADMSIDSIHGGGTSQGLAFSTDGNVLLGLAGFLPPDGASPPPAPGVRIDDQTAEGLSYFLSGKSFGLGVDYLYPGGRLEFWNSRDNRPVARVVIEDDDPNGWIGSFAFNSEGSVLAYGTTNGRIGLWDLWGGRMIKTIAVAAQADDGGHVRCLAFNDDGDVLVGTTGMRLLVWTLRDNKLAREIDLRGGPYSRMAVSLAIDPAPTIAVLGFSDGRVELWDLEAGNRKAVFHFLEGFKRTLETVTRILKS